ncbi:MAG: hypothetical protein GY856_34925 [bacterium]|nr:hypothetical protein [bacterium]
MRWIAHSVRIRTALLPGLCLALVLASGTWAMQEPEADGGEPAPGRVVRIQVDSIIHPVAAQYAGRCAVVDDSPVGCEAEELS